MGVPVISSVCHSSCQLPSNLPSICLSLCQSVSQRVRQVVFLLRCALVPELSLFLKVFFLWKSIRVLCIRYGVSSSESIEIHRIGFLWAVSRLIWFITWREGQPLSVVDFRLDRLWLAALGFLKISFSLDDSLTLLPVQLGVGLLPSLIHWMGGSSLSIWWVRLLSSVLPVVAPL